MNGFQIYNEAILEIDINLIGFLLEECLGFFRILFYFSQFFRPFDFCQHI